MYFPQPQIDKLLITHWVGGLLMHHNVQKEQHLGNGGKLGW